ncbi:MAG TPA: hypothetical protein PK971_01035, partial [Saprospiraceae bacterium]|nr:hypothetical protein [Saprospiraceae bacterium]
MKKISLLLFLSCAMAALATAQPINTSTPEANLKAAQEAEANDNPYEALDRYEKVYDDGKDKAIAAKIAKMNYDLRDYERAERGFSKLVLRDRKGEFTELRYWLAMSMKRNGKYQDAIDQFSQYISDGADENLKKSAKMEVEGCKLAQKAKQPDNLLIGNIGKKANSPQTEGSPSYSGGTLYYASLQGKEVVVLDGKEGDWFSKIYSTTANGTEFGAPQALDQQINREGFHQGNVSVSPDGKTMYFTRAQLAEKGQALTESKIYYSTKNSEGWGAANEAKGVNGDFIAK